jgi:hypothetical protein
MNAYFINPFSQKITTVDYDGDYQSISRMIDASRGYFDVVRLYGNQDAAFVDDEGLYVEDQQFWIHRNYPQPLAGKALVLGCNEEGDSIEPQTSFETLTNDIRFIGDRFELVLLHKFVGNIDDYRPHFFKDLETA